MLLYKGTQATNAKCYSAGLMAMDMHTHRDQAQGRHQLATNG